MEPYLENFQKFNSNTGKAAYEMLLGLQERHPGGLPSNMAEKRFVKLVPKEVQRFFLPARAERPLMGEKRPLSGVAKGGNQVVQLPGRGEGWGDKWCICQGVWRGVWRGGVAGQGVP